MFSKRQLGYELGVIFKIFNKTTLILDIYSMSPKKTFKNFQDIFNDII